MPFEVTAIYYKLQRYDEAMKTPAGTPPAATPATPAPTTGDAANPTPAPPATN
jgi:hypothetical protein